MIPPQIVEQVQSLLAQKRWSYRQIAAMLGVSRSTVSVIANDQRPLPRETPEELELEQTAPPVRCPGCGGLVYLPCRLCRVRRWQRRRAAGQRRQRHS